MPKLCTFFTFRPVGLLGLLGQLGWSDHKTQIGPKAPLACLNVYKSYIYVEFFHLETPYRISNKLVEKYQIYASFSLFSQLAGWVVGRFGWLACSNAYESHTHVESFHLETPYQISSKLVEKCQSYARFSLLGR